MSCRAGTLQFSFDQTNPEALAWARDRSARLVTAVTTEARRAIRAVVAEAFRNGGHPSVQARTIRAIVGLTERDALAVMRRQMALYAEGRDAAQVLRMTERYANRLHKARALTIARTETMAASNQGQQALWDQAVRQGHMGRRSMKAWLVADPCPLCAPLEEETVPVGDNFSTGGNPPLHPNAVFAGSRFVSYGDVLELVRARYDGPAVHVHAGDYATTIGPNHPMLTARGMVRAADLREGDEVLYDTRVDGAVRAGEPHFEEVPLVEDVFESARTCGSYARVAAPGPDLHGDRVFCQGEVEVVRPARQLLPVWDSGGVEQLREGPLVRTDSEAERVSRARAGGESGDRVALSAPGGVRGPDAWVLADHFVWLRVTAVAVGTFSGAAFDASTQSSLYCSAGFVVSNCRCTVGLVEVSA